MRSYPSFLSPAGTRQSEFCTFRSPYYISDISEKFQLSPQSFPLFKILLPATLLLSVRTTLAALNDIKLDLFASEYYGA